jgi:sugar transferase (PEP-CTERM/EpsH1 system associated)
VNVLFLCHRFPYPPDHGGKIRSFNVIRHLTEQGHDVTVASLARSRREAQEATGIAPYCARFFAARVSPWMAAIRMAGRVPSPIPSAMGYFYSPELARYVGGTLARTSIDLIFVHCAFVAPYVAHVAGIRKVLDFADMDSQKWLAYATEKPFPISLGYWIEGTKLQRAEARLARRFDLCTCTTQAELDTLAGHRPGVRLGWFPNGVDTEYFQPTSEPYEADALVFIGRMDYYPNQECMLNFCRTTLPLIRRQRPKVTLAIVGADPPAAIRALGRLPGVTVTGSVPDVRPYVHRAAAAVAPLRIARGTQNKILEAMAMGVPVVTSPIAARGVDAEPGRHLLTASSPAEYAAATLTLMTDRAARQTYAEAGRVRMLSHHQWSRSMAILDRLLVNGDNRG